MHLAWALRLYGLKGCSDFSDIANFSTALHKHWIKFFFFFLLLSEKEIHPYLRILHPTIYFQLYCFSANAGSHVFSHFSDDHSYLKYNEV